MSVSPITPLLITPVASPSGAPAAPVGAGHASQGPSFSAVIGDALKQVDQMQMQANEASAQVASGQTAELHDALIRVEEASLSLQLALQVRNKLVESYQEIMRMPV